MATYNTPVDDFLALIELQRYAQVPGRRMLAHINGLVRLDETQISMCSLSIEEYTPRGACISGSLHAHTCPAVRYAPDMKAVMEQHADLRKKIVGQLIDVNESQPEDVETLLV